MEINKIYCESNLETMAKMPDNFIDLTVTSPPYDNLRTYKNEIDKSWGEHIWKPIIKELYRVTKKGGVVVWVVGDATINGSESGTSFKQALYAIECGFNLHDTMIWNKHSYNHDPRNHRYKQYFEYMFIFSKEKPKTYNEIKDVKSLNAGKIMKSSKRKANGEIRKFKAVTIGDFQARSNIWELNVEARSEHPAPFSEDLAKDHIYTWSNEGDLIYDPFMGSGTTAKMAHIYKRNWIGSEISQEYVNIANKRLQPYLDQQTLF